MAGGAAAPSPAPASADGSNGALPPQAAARKVAVEVKKVKFEGRIEGLKGHIYDITGYKSQDMFDTTTKEVVDHIRSGTQKYAFDAAEYIRILKEPDWKAERPRLTPVDPTKPTQEEKEDYAADLEEWKAKKKYVTINLKQAFGIVWSQCSDTIRSKIEAKNGFDNILSAGNVIELLKMIRSTMMDFHSHKDINQTHSEMLRRFYTLFQDKRTTLKQHRDRFDAMVAQLDYVGATVGGHPKAVQVVLDRMTASSPPRASVPPTADEVREATAVATEEFLAAHFVLTADKGKYGVVVERLENDKLMRLGEWPKTREQAFDLLFEYKNDPRNIPTTGVGASGMAFTTVGSSAVEVEEEATLAHSHVDEDDDDDVSVGWAFVQASLCTNDDSIINTWWILLDNQSTVDVFCNKKLLQNIRKSKGNRTISIASNGGVSTTNLVGDLPGYGTVWYDPNGIANILSFANVAKRWEVSITIEGGNPVFVVHKDDGPDRYFRQSPKGLYYHDVSNNKDADEHAALFVNTVDDNKSKFSKRDYSRAVTARQLQQTIGRPSTAHLIKILDTGLIPNCPVSSQDVKNAEVIFGPDVGSLKGKTTWHKGKLIVPTPVNLPVTIMDKYREVVLSIDVIFVNGIAFFVSVSHHIKFTTAEVMDRQSDVVMQECIERIRKLYAQRGFIIVEIRGDGRFQSLEGADCVKGIRLNTTAREEHDPDIERNNRTLKERIRSVYQMLPFNKCMPRRVVIELVYACVFWLNCFQPSGGISASASPRTIVTGMRIDYERHCKIEFGTYAQTHEEHDNSMHERTTGAIGLRPSGNAQGGFLFYSLNTGRVLHRQRWTALPMPSDVIDHVIRRGRMEKAVGGLVFGDREGRQNGDAFVDFDDEGDDDYSPDEDDTPDGDVSLHRTFTPIESDEILDITGVDSTNDSTLPTNEMGNVGNTVETEADCQSLHDSDSERQSSVPVNETVTESTGVDDSDDRGWSEREVQSNYFPAPTNETDDISGEAGVSAETPGVDDKGTTADQEESELDQRLSEHVIDEYTSRYELRPRRKKVDYYESRSRTRKHKQRKPDCAMVTIDQPQEWMMLCFEHAFVTEQFNMKKGLKVFGEKGMEAVMNEMRQLHDRRVMFPKDAKRLTHQEKKDALNYLMFLKEKRSGKIKGRGCADGRKQRIYKSKDETTSPTVTTESFFISAVMDAEEGRDVAFVDVPGAFMQADMPDGEIVHIKLRAEMAKMMVKIDPSLYKTYVVEERGEPVIYAQLTKALYGQLEAALLFWKKLSQQFVDWEFERNEYDWCVVNKQINGSQCTILWHVDDLKISHKDENVVSKIIDDLDKEYGQQIVLGERAELTVSRGKVHEYLGMTIDYSEKGKVKISMEDYVDDMLADLPPDMEGTAVTPAANHMFQINPYSRKLDDEMSDKYHHFTAKLLYLSRRARPDIQTAVSFLCTRVKEPDHDDWKKLRRVMRYLRKTKHLKLTLEAGNFNALRMVQWWVDASYAVHPDLKSHTGAYMTLGKGTLYATSAKQKLNTKSSTEAELVGVDDIMGQALWTRNFLEAQGYEVKDNLIYQDNQSAILLERNGRASSSKRTKHINVRYFFVTDRISTGEVDVVYCPTKEMIGDFFTKPLQGALFRKFRALILNLEEDDYGVIDDNDPVDTMVDKENISPVTGDVATRNHRSVLGGMDRTPDGGRTPESRAPHKQSVTWSDVVKGTGGNKGSIPVLRQ